MTANNTDPVEGQLRVWHIPQVPGEPFHVPVASVDEAVTVLNALADYDRFQFDNQIKPDYANAQGLEIFEGEDWCEWYDNVTGYDIDSTIMMREAS